VFSVRADPRLYNEDYRPARKELSPVPELAVAAEKLVGFRVPSEHLVESWEDGVESSGVEGVLTSGQRRDHGS
jgi:hypothetical protein